MLIYWLLLLTPASGLEAPLRCDLPALRYCLSFVCSSPLHKQTSLKSELDLLHIGHLICNIKLQIWLCVK